MPYAKIKENMKTLRLILGDQLNPCHSWFSTIDPNVFYILLEIRQETDYVLHHAQKIIAIFAGMRDLARQLREDGHRLHYLHIDDPENTHSITTNLTWLAAQYQIREIEYQAPDEWRLDQQLHDFSDACGVPCRMVDSEHFYTSQAEVGQIFHGSKKCVLFSHTFR